MAWTRSIGCSLPDRRIEKGEGETPARAQARPPVRRAATVCSVPGCPHAAPCPDHPARRGSTRAWRRVREQVLRRDRFRCQECGAFAVEVVTSWTWLSAAGTSRTTCARCACAVTPQDTHDDQARGEGRERATRRRPTALRPLSFPARSCKSRSRVCLRGSGPRSRGPFPDPTCPGVSGVGPWVQRLRDSRDVFREREWVARSDDDHRSQLLWLTKLNALDAEVVPLGGSVEPRHELLPGRDWRIAFRAAPSRLALARPPIPLAPGRHCRWTARAGRSPGGSGTRWPPRQGRRSREPGSPLAACADRS